MARASAVAFRRWILFPPLIAVGSGDTSNANALWVMGHSPETPIWGPRPSSPDWVRWPPAGYTPYQLVYKDWSLSFNPAPADFTNAIVTMKMGSTNLSVTNSRPGRVRRQHAGVAAPVGAALGLGSGMADKTVTVTVSNIAGRASRPR